jgi:hypothetical protein
MRLPFLSRRRQVVRQPRTPVAIAFSMEDFAEIRGYSAVLAPYGVAWRVDAMDTLRPEVAIIYRNGMPNFQLWRTTTGYLLRCLDPKRDAGTIELPDQTRAWLLVCALTTPPVWLATEQEGTTGSRALACLLKWIRA